MLFSFFFEVEFLATVTTFKLLASLFHIDHLLSRVLRKVYARSRQHPHIQMGHDYSTGLGHCVALYKFVRSVMIGVPPLMSRTAIVHL
jgi:hypothetical protein